MVTPKDEFSSIFKIWTVVLPQVWDCNHVFCFGTVVLPQDWDRNYVFCLNVIEMCISVNADLLNFARVIKIDRSLLVNRNSAYFGEARESVL